MSRALSPAPPPSLCTMATANEGCSSHTADVNMRAAKINAGGCVGCGIVNGDNNTVHQHFGKSDLSGSNADTMMVTNVISWLYPIHSIDYFPMHDKARSQRAEHTGKWFFDSMKYKLWATVGFGKYRNLACVGIPGAGKTTMAATVVKYLQDGFLAKRGLDIVLYAYFRHDTQTTQTIPLVLASLLLQVVKHKRKISTGVQKFYEDYSSREILLLPIDVMVSLLRSELSGFGRAYIIVDALDEFALPDYTRSSLLLEELQRLNARLLITSRYDVGLIPNTFSTIRVSAHESDIRIFVLKHLSGHLATVVARTPGLLEEIVLEVVKKSAGMFIVATLLVSCIPNSQSLTASDIRAAVKELPTGIEDTYEMAVRRIQDQEPHLAELGKQALYWVYFSKRRLTVMELRHALSFQYSKVISEKDIIGEDRILSACAGLISFVKLKDKRKTVECQFSHFTTREFLGNSGRKYLLNGERRIVETCIGYLVAATSGIPSDITKNAQLRLQSQKNHVTDSTWKQFGDDGRGLALCAYAVEYLGLTPNTFSTLRDTYILVQAHLRDHFPTAVAETPGVLEEIVHMVAIKSAGIFVFATLLVNCIPTSQALTAEELLAVVKDLPRGIQGIYEMVFKRTQDQEPYLAALGMDALAWVYFSKRRLTVTELQHALSFHRSKAILEDLIGEDQILSACSGLISTVKLGDKRKTAEYQFSHFTAREFLDKTWQQYFMQGERHITGTCLKYLVAAASHVPSCMTNGSQLGPRRQDSMNNTPWKQFGIDHGLALCAYAVDYLGLTPNTFSTLRDIYIFVQKYLRDHVPAAVAETPGMLEEIVHTVAAKSAGIFVVATLLVNCIPKSQTVLTADALRTVVKDLPRGTPKWQISTIHKRLINQIRSQEPELAGLGMDALAWAYFSKRQSTMTELQHALSFHRSKVIPEDLIDEDRILSACAGLITVMPKGMRKTLECQFSHATTKGFLDEFLPAYFLQRKLLINRIRSQEPDLAGLGMDALAWVYLSKRHLTMTELQHALSFHRSKVIPSPEDLIDEDRILSACAGLLITVKPQDMRKTIECQFSHSTTKGFLDETWREYFLQGKRHITETCLGYLAAAVPDVPLDVMDAARCGPGDENHTKWKEYCDSHELSLCGYAMEFLAPDNFNGALHEIYMVVQERLADHFCLTHAPGLLGEIVQAVITKSYTHALINVLANQHALPHRLLLVAKFLTRCIPNIRPSLNADELLAAVKKLPSEIEDTYKMAMTQVQEQEPHLAELGKQTLCWVYHSERPLTVMELRQALSFQRSKEFVPNNQIISEDQILSACAGLVSFVQFQGKQITAMICQIFDPSARKFLDKSRPSYILDGERQITETCLGYLAAAASHVPPGITKAAQQGSGNSEWWRYCEDHDIALRTYAVVHWANHARAIDEEFDLSGLSSLFKNPISPYMANENATLVYPYHSMAPNDYWILYLARYGLLKLLQKHAGLPSAERGAIGLQEVPVDYNAVRDRVGNTALHLSAVGGHLEVVKFLLDNGADVKLLNDSQRSPLHFALQAGSSGATTVQLLLDHGATVD